jgi:hypothetical protein
MPADLKKSITRRTRSAIWSQGKNREIVISIEPIGETGVLIGFRLSGTRQTFHLSAETAFRLAVEHQEQIIQRQAKRIAAETGRSLRSALCLARKKVQGV